MMGVENIALLFLMIIPGLLCCTLVTYQSFHDAVYETDATAGYKFASVGISDCKRACMLTKYCNAFNMHWAGSKRNIGSCELVTSMTEDYSISAANSNFYGRSCQL